MTLSAIMGALMRDYRDGVSCGGCGAALGPLGGDLGSLSTQSLIERLLDSQQTAQQQARQAQTFWHGILQGAGQAGMRLLPRRRFPF